MSRIGENIRLRKDGRWEGRYLHCDSAGNTVCKSVYGHSYWMVKEKLIQVAGHDSNGHEFFSDWALQWLATRKPPRTKPPTYSQYICKLESHILPRLGRIPMEKINSDSINQFALELLENGRLDGNGGLAPKTAKDIISIVLQILHLAYERGDYRLIGEELLSIPIPRKEIRVLEIEDEKSLNELLFTATDFGKIGVLLMLYTGIRVGELCALRYSDIHLQEGAVSIRRTMERIRNTNPEIPSKTTIWIGTPKSISSIRNIPLPTFLIDPIFQCKRRAEPDGYVLTGKSNRYLEPRAFQYRFKRYLVEAGIANINLHALRHTFATRCAELAFDHKSLSEILGHSSVSFTIDRYVHSNFYKKKVQMERQSPARFSAPPASEVS